MGVLGASWERLGVSWERLGVSCGVLEASWVAKPPRVWFLTQLSMDLGSDLDPENYKNHLFFIGFSTFFGFSWFSILMQTLDGFWCHLGSILVRFVLPKLVLGASWGILGASWGHVGAS